MTHHKNTPNRRTVLASLGSIATLSGVAGCLGGNGEDDGEGGADTIEFWTTQVQEDRQQIYNELIDRFEADHDGSIDMIAVEEDDLPAQISSAVAADTLPTLGEWGLETMQELGTEDLLSSSSASNVIESVGEDDFYDGALSLTTSPDDDPYAVPAYGWVQGFWYRESKFEELGLDEPTTWDALYEAAEALHNPDEDEYGIVVGSDDTAFTRQCFTPIAHSNDARVFDEDGEIVFDSPEMVEALEFYGSLSEYSPPGLNDVDDARNTFVNEQSFLIEYSSFIMNDINDSDLVDADDVGFAHFIEHERQSSFGQIVTLSLIDTASDDELHIGEEYVDHLLTDEEYIDFLHMAPGGMNPVLEGIAEDEAYRDNEVLQEWDEEVLQNISDVFDTIEIFSHVDGQTFPEYSEITSRYLIAEAVRRVSEGDDAETVTSEQADAMREFEE